MDLRGKKALVTGASKGIGQATAIALAREGCSVAINFNTDSAGAARTLEACDAHADGNILIQADIANENDISMMFDRLRTEWGHLDILINNAGIFDDEDCPTNIDVFDTLYRINFRSVVMVTKYALPLIRIGKVVNVSSIHGRLGHGRPSAIAYSAFKAAIDSYTKNIAKELAPDILVNTIAPGRVATPMWGSPDMDQQRELGAVHLIKRMIQPDEIGNGIVFLCKNDAICGEILTIDGGMSLVTLG